MIAFITGVILVVLILTVARIILEYMNINSKDISHVHYKELKSDLNDIKEAINKSSHKD